MPKALKGDLGTVDRVLKIEERRAKLLGLDSPEKHDLAVSRKIPWQAADEIVAEWQERHSGEVRRGS